MRRFVVLTLLVAAGLALSSGPAFAQATGSITGTVLDQDALVLPGVTVVATNTDTGATRETVTSGTGNFTIPALIPGPYEVRAELAGFDPALGLADVVTASTVTVDLQMGIAQLEETVIVRGAAPLVEVTQAVVASSIRQEEVRELPMINRSLSAMMNLLPGAREVEASGSHGHASNYVSFAGNTGRSYNMYVDGIDNKEDQDGGTLLQYSLDGIEEFRALGAGFQAEYGRGSTVVTLATRSGTNEFTGTGFVQGRNQSMGATDYYSRTENGGLGEQPFNRIQFGGSGGGPLNRDSAWIFVAAERIRQQFQLPRSQGVVNEHQAIFDAGVVDGVVVKPALAQPFRDLLFQVRADVRMGEDHTAFLKLASQHGYVDNATWNSQSHMSREPYLSRNDQSMYAAVGGWTWVVDNTAVNEFRMQYMYYLHTDINGAPCDLGNAAWSQCLTTRLGFPSVGTDRPFFAQEDWVNYETKLEFVNNFSKQIGSHYVKFGVDYAQLPTFYANLMVWSPGRIRFWDDPSVILNNTNGRYPQGFHTPGIVRDMIVSSQNQVDAWSHDSWFFAGYIQDDWQVVPKLTLNLGLRYDINELMNNKNWEQNRTWQVLRDIGSPFGGLPQTDTNNWGPRLGFAYDVAGDGANVIRGSFGLFYATGIITSAYSQGLLEQDTIFIRSTIANSEFGVGPLANYTLGDPVPFLPPADPAELPHGGNTAGSTYHPDFADAYSINSSLGFSHLFTPTTVFSVDYLNVQVRNGWRRLQVNDFWNNPMTGVRERFLTQDLVRVYNDPARVSAMSVLCACNEGTYDGIDVHFEHRFQTGGAFQVNYTLAWARGMGGSTDFTTQGAFAGPERWDGTDQTIYGDSEWGPTAYDERHRITFAGSFPLPAGFSIAPLMTFATSRPYTAYGGFSEFGVLQYIKDENGNPAGPYNTRGVPLFNLNARITKTFDFASGQNADFFVEFYNITNRANFGNSFNGNAWTPAFGTPTSFLGGAGSTSTLPVSFQVQVGARYEF